MSGRGQTNLDFAIGAGVFLIVLAFTLTAAPTVFEPLDRSVQSETVIADRIATETAEERLGSPESPHVADRGCAFAFFDDETDDGTYSTGMDTSAGNPDTVDGCSYDDGPFDDRIGTDDRTSVNVRLVRDLTTGTADNPSTGTDDSEPSTLCYDADNDRVVEESSPCDFLFDVGDDPEGVSSTSVARRTVRIEGGFADGTSDARLIVEVW